MNDISVFAVDIYRETGNVFYLIIGSIVLTIPVYFYLVKIGKDTFSLFGYRREKCEKSMHLALESEYVGESMKSMVRDELETEIIRKVFGKTLTKDTLEKVENIYGKVKRHIGPKKLVRISDFMEWKDKNAVIGFSLPHRLAFWYVTIIVLTQFFGATLVGGFFVFGQDYLAKHELMTSLIIAFVLYTSAILTSQLNNDYWIAKRVKKLLQEANEKSLSNQPEEDVDVEK